MKAVFVTNYGGPEVLVVKETNRPVPKENEILVKVNAASITTADSMMRSGTPRLARLFVGISRPKKPIIGTGFAGVVEETGNNVLDFETGDAVFGLTGMNFAANAEYVCVPVTGVVFPKPDYLSFEEAAVMYDGPTTSFNFLKNLADIKPGQKVLINGASGSLGVAAVQIAKHMGAEVTAVCSTANVSLVQSLGADHVIDYKKQDFTKGKVRYDVIYDTVGKSSFSKAKKVLTAKGMYLSPVLGLRLMLQMMVNGLRGGKKAKFDATGMKPVQEFRKMIDELKEIIKTGSYNMVIENRYTMEQIVDAHRYIDSGRKRGNIVLSV